MQADEASPERVAYDKLMEAIEAYSELYPGNPDAGMEHLGSKLLEVSQERYSKGWVGYFFYLKSASG